jgi:hypothetical protein
MKPNPFTAREALARLPRFTQRFWTWLTGLTHSNEAPRKPWSADQHVLVFLATCVLAFALAAWTTQQMVLLALPPLI